MTYHVTESMDDVLSSKFVNEFQIDGLKFTSVDQYVAFRKAGSFPGNETLALDILATNDSDLISHFRHKVRNMDPFFWKDMSYDVAKNATRAKFQSINSAKKLLLDTKNLKILQEGTSPTWSLAGENRMGQILMEVRDELNETIARPGS